MMRVRSKVFYCHEGTLLATYGKVNVVLWDNGCFSYLHEDEFVRLDKEEAAW